LKIIPKLASFAERRSFTSMPMRGKETWVMLKGYGLTTAELFYRIAD
jgi:hypothetical protein